jgi:hypothetical protein
MAWTPASDELVASITASGCTLELAKSHWPPWAKEGNKFRRLFVYSLPPGESVPSSATTSQQVARLLTERYDPADEAPYNYNWYVIVKRADGTHWQSSPCRDVDFGHHLRESVPEVSLKVSDRSSGVTGRRIE